MKVLYHRSLKAANKLLALLLAVLGFSSCDKSDEELVVMYGTPIATFSIKGKVVNAEKEAIPNIQITFAGKYSGDNQTWFRPIPDTITTNARGEFAAHLIEMPASLLRLYATDTDGAANKAYANDSIDIKIDKLTGGDGGWNQGSFSKEDILIELKENKTDE